MSSLPKSKISGITVGSTSLLHTSGLVASVLYSPHALRRINNLLTFPLVCNQYPSLALLILWHVRGKGLVKCLTKFVLAAWFWGQLKFLWWAWTIAPHHNTLRNTNILKKKAFRQQQLGVNDAWKSSRCICMRRSVTLQYWKCLLIGLAILKAMQKLHSLNLCGSSGAFCCPFCTLLWFFVDQSVVSSHQQNKFSVGISQTLSSWLLGKGSAMPN